MVCTETLRPLRGNDPHPGPAMDPVSTRRLLTGVAVLLLMAPVPSAAQVLVTGRILDAADGTPISLASVDLLDSEGDSLSSTRADGAGTFRFHLETGGRFLLRGRRIGYEAGVEGPLVLEPGDTVAVDLRMGTRPLELPGLEVIASRRPWFEHLVPQGLWTFYGRMERNRSLGIGRFITRGELRQWGGTPVALVVASVPGMSAHRDTRGRGYRLSGRGGCAPLVFLDGMEVRMEGTTLDDLVRVDVLEGVEVYRGPSELPAELFGTNFRGACGAVALWTRRGPR